MTIQHKEQLINDYINAYNSFNVDGMLKDLDPAIVFENESNGDVTMRLNGLTAFKAQAEEATRMFEKRTQIIENFTHSDGQSEIDITYHAIIALDLPNGLKCGQELNLTGKSIFSFADQKIIKIKDIS